MTVSSEQSRVQYATDGVATSFPVPFRFLSGQHLRVSFALGDDDAVDLVLGRDFDAVGTGNASGGTITTYAAYPLGGSIAIERVVPITQETAYQRNDPFPERAHEQALDKLTMICQMLGGYFGLTPGSVQRALTLGKHDRDGRGAYRARNNRITDLGDPQTDTDAVNRRSMFSFVVEYVDRAIAGVSGGFGWFLQKGLGAIYRPFQSKMRDVVSVLDFITTPVDGTASNQEGIVAAVAAADALGADLNWPAADGDYISTDNIPGFWNVRHTGSGRIKRGDTIWHITPSGDQENTIWVGPNALSSNDGLSLSSPLSAQSAFDCLSRIGAKAADGQWTVRISGTINHNGVRITKPLPMFTRRLQILGDDVPGLNDVPTTVWDGSGSTLRYGFRIERNVAPALFLLMRNIKFVNWDKGAGSGAVVIWDAGGVRGENLHVDGADVGLWFNRCDVVIERGVIENCTTRGASFEYHSKFNIGRVDRDYGVTIKNCGSGVQIGRHTVGYVQGCILENNRVNINPSRISRWRSRNNLHKNWIDAAYNSSLVGVFTPDNDAGQPDIFEHTDPNAQVYVAQQGSIHMHIERGGHRTVHLVSDGNLVDIANRSGASVLLSGEGGPSFTPFRLPAFALKNTSIRIDVEILALVSAGATGVFALNGAGPGAGVRMASCTIPSLGSDTTYKISISVFRQPGLSTVRYRVKLETANGHSIQSGSFSNPNNAAISAHSEAQLLYRLYWEPTTNANVRFYAMRSYVEY